MVLNSKTQNFLPGQVCTLHFDRFTGVLMYFSLGEGVHLNLIDQKCEVIFTWDYRCRSFQPCLIRRHLVGQIWKLTELKKMYFFGYAAMSSLFPKTLFSPYLRPIFDDRQQQQHNSASIIVLFWICLCDKIYLENAK